MKRQIGILLFLVVVLMPQLVRAHSVNVDGTISALIHIDPNDNPVIGRSAFIEFSVTDSAKQFSFSQCDCTLTVKNNAQQTNDVLRPSQLIVGDNNTAGFSYTFFEKGSYELGLVGTPKNKDDFQSFALVFDVRITNDGTGFSLPPLHSYNYLHTGLFLGVFVIFFGIHFYQKIKNRKS